MSIIRNASGNESTAASQQAREADPHARDTPREPAPKESVDRFQALMQRQEAGSEAPSRHAGLPSGAEDAARGETTAAPARDHGHYGSQTGGDASDNPGGNPGGDADALPPAELAALLQGHAATRDAPVAMTTAPSVNTPAFAELIERHVRQLAVSEGGATHGDGQVLLRLSDATLPGTDLLLTRTADGWMLRADVRSRGSFDAIREAAPQLAERFAERNLGTLVIEPHLHA